MQLLCITNELRIRALPLNDYRAPEVSLDRGYGCYALIEDRSYDNTLMAGCCLTRCGVPVPINWLKRMYDRVRDHH